jgi:hypothetical protein
MNKRIIIKNQLGEVYCLYPLDDTDEQHIYKILGSFPKPQKYCMVNEYGFFVSLGSGDLSWASNIDLVALPPKGVVKWDEMGNRVETDSMGHLIVSISYNGILTNHYKILKPAFPRKVQYIQKQVGREKGQVKIGERILTKGEADELKKRIAFYNSLERQ